MEVRCLKCRGVSSSQTLSCSARKSSTFARSKGGVREGDYTQTILKAWSVEGDAPTEVRYTEEVRYWEGRLSEVPLYK